MGQELCRFNKKTGLELFLRGGQKVQNTGKQIIALLAKQSQRGAKGYQILLLAKVRKIGAKHCQSLQ